MSAEYAKEWATRCDAGETSTAIAKEFGTTRNTVLGAVWRYRQAMKRANTSIVSVKYPVKGQRVKMTKKAEQTFRRASRTGVIIRVGYDGLIVVLADGRKSTARYHPSFWEPDSPISGLRG